MTIDGEILMYSTPLTPFMSLMFNNSIIYNAWKKQYEKLYILRPSSLNLTENMNALVLIS